MHIGCDVTDTGLELRLDGRRFPVRFPADVWRAFPHKDAFVDHYAFIKALHLPGMLRRDLALEYDTTLPLFRHAMYLAVLNNVAFCADVDGVPTAEELRRFLAMPISFADHRTRAPAQGRVLDDRAVVNMSLGKDSLLTYAVARELGLRPVLYISVDNDCPREYAYKADIAARFSAEFGETVQVVQNDTGVIHRYEYWGTPPTEWGFGHLITEYALLALPFAWAHAARFVLLGNEKSCDDTYVTRDGFRAWPVYDQSSEWSLELANIARGLMASPVTVMSLIEPLHDLAIVRILHTRYPEIAKYQMSCFPDENEHGRHGHWCGHCTKCARNFAFLHANGIDPKRVGHHVDMFQADGIDHFALLRGAKKGLPAVGYDATPCGRDEQLYALYLAHGRGARGPVMDVFARDFLDEARARRDELERRFFTVQPARTIPEPLLTRVHKLYADALR
jgi:hypothetical protein